MCVESLIDIDTHTIVCDMLRHTCIYIYINDLNHR